MPKTAGKPKPDSRSSSSAPRPPLVLDLDGALLRTDFLTEVAFAIKDRLGPILSAPMGCGFTVAWPI